MSSFLGEHSPTTSPKPILFDSTGYLSVGELSGVDDEDDSQVEAHTSNFRRDSVSDYFLHQSDQTSTSSEAPATLDDSIKNRVLSRSGWPRHLTASLNDTSKIVDHMNDKQFQSDTGLFNFPALNAQPIRTVPSDLTIVSEIISTSPSASLSRSKRIKNPSLSGGR